jgi:hypothetical protein
MTLAERPIAFALPPVRQKERPMAQSFSLVVRVERAGKAFGEAMSEIRLWLDSHEIQPTSFKADTAAPGPVAFEIKFQREDEAHFFEQEFT